MLLALSLAVAAPMVDIPELARRGAPMVAHCTSAAPVRRLMEGSPVEALLGRVDLGDGPMSLAMWDKDHMELRVAHALPDLPLPERTEGDVHVYGNGFVGSPPIQMDKSLAVLAQTRPGCTAWIDMSRLPDTGAKAVRQEGQLLLMLPEAGGPLEFAMASDEWKGRAKASRHLDLDIRANTPPFVVLAMDGVANVRPSDPERRKQAAQMRAFLPLDGMVLGFWLPTDGAAPYGAGTISLASNIKAAALGKRLGAALDHGKVPYTREGELLHFRVGDVPALAEVLGTSGEAARAAGMIGSMELWMQPGDGQLRFGTSRASLQALGTGEPMVGEDMRKLLTSKDFVVTIQPHPMVSDTDKPVVMTMVTADGAAFGSVDVPKGYLAWEKLSTLLGGNPSLGGVNPAP